MFYFLKGQSESLYLSSADWMNRNMLRRVELAWPVEDPALRQRIVDECLMSSLKDNVDAWELNSDGHYTRAVPTRSRALKPKPLMGAQATLMALYNTKT